MLGALSVCFSLWREVTSPFRVLTVSFRKFSSLITLARETQCDVPYSGKFSLVQIFAELLINPLEEI